MDRPAYSPDLNSIEHVWDALGKRNAARLHHPENTQQLKQMLIEEWVLLPQEMLHQLVLSMRRRQTKSTRNGFEQKPNVPKKIYADVNFSFLPSVYEEPTNFPFICIFPLASSRSDIAC
ncbi:transposable element Tcb2 transposase [Trichonephila clavipes]|nr:transposable element Tcb2 transposase [Trichonephila clavipes]